MVLVPLLFRHYLPMCSVGHLRVPCEWSWSDNNDRIANCHSFYGSNQTYDEALKVFGEYFVTAEREPRGSNSFTSSYDDGLVFWLEEVISMLSIIINLLYQNALKTFTYDFRKLFSERIFTINFYLIV